MSGKRRGKKEEDTSQKVPQVREKRRFDYDITLLIPDGPVDSATVPVSWCLPEDTALALAKRGTNNAYLLISVQNGKQETNRQLVPIGDGMTYIQFHKPGHNVVNASIVFCDDYHRRWTLRRLSSRQFDWCLYDHDNFDPSLHFEYIGLGALDVEVPKELFAKEPPTWLKRWVNLMFETSLVDECHFRKRLPFALFLQPFLLAFVSVIMMVLLAGMLAFGVRPNKFNWRCFLWGGLPWEDVDKEDFFFFFRPEPRGSCLRKKRHPAVWPFAPIVSLVLFLIALVTKGVIAHGWEDSVAATFVRQPCFAARWLLLESFGVAVAISLSILMIHGIAIGVKTVAIAIWEKLGSLSIDRAVSSRDKYQSVERWLDQGNRRLWISMIFFATVPAVFVAWPWSADRHFRGQDFLGLVSMILLVVVATANLANWVSLRKERTREEERRASDSRRILLDKLISGEIKANLAGLKQVLPEEISELACSGTKPRPLTFSELPKHRRTVRLRFWDLKAKVCKPFSW